MSASHAPGPPGPWWAATIDLAIRHVTEIATAVSTVITAVSMALRRRVQTLGRNRKRRR